MTHNPVTIPAAPSSSFAGLSLWLIPKEAHGAAIAEAMNQVRHIVATASTEQELQSMNLSAPFSPHATLLSGLEADEGWTKDKVWSTFRLAYREWAQQHRQSNSTLDQISCDMDQITTRGLYFQCILIALQKTGQLASLNQIMRTAFKVDDATAYFPHCSLLYAHLQPTQTDACLQRIQKEGLQHFIAAQLGTDRSSNPITFDAVELWDTNGEVSQWSRLEHVRLQDLSP